MSFLLIGRLAERGAQLEVTTSSQLGEFVQERFNQLWDDKTTKTLERFMYLPVTITEDDRNERWEFAPSYVQVDGTSYVIASKEMLTVMARRRGGSLQAYLDRNPSIRYGFDVVDENEPELYGRLIKRFTQKYDTHADTFVGFTPLPATEPHPATEPLSS